MKNNLFFGMFIFFALSLLFACNAKDEDEILKQECGEELAVGLNVNSVTDFNTQSDLNFRGNLYRTSIQDVGGYALVGLSLTVVNICNSSNPNINFQLDLKNTDPTVTCACELRENGNKNLVTDIGLIKPSAGYYNYNSDYTFSGNFGGGPGSLTLGMSITFPSKGSVSADSVYFFKNLNTTRVGMLAKEPAE